MLAVLFCAALALPARTVVVLPIAGDGAIPAELRVALASIPGLSIQSAGATADSLAAANALGLSCDASAPSCMAELGGLANGDLVVGGALERDGSLRLRLVDVASTKELRSTSLALPASGPPRARAMRLLAVRLAAPERERGELMVHVSPSGASIVVDGAPRGLAPLRAPIALAPGTHDVYVALLGYVSVSFTVEVQFDDAAVLDVDLVREGAPAFVDEAPERAAEHVRPSRIAITSVEAPGVATELTRAIAASIADEIGKLEQTTVFGVEDVPRRLTPSNALMLACREAACSQLLATELAVDTLIQVDVTVDDEQSRVAIRRIDGGSGALLREESRGVLRGDALESQDLVDAAAFAVRAVFPDRHLRQGEMRGSVRSIADSARPGLPRWVFYSSLAATGAAAGAAGGLLLWSSVETDPGTKNALELSMWIALGTAAALGVVDVTTGLATDW